MVSNHKPGFFRICLVLIFLLSAGSLIASYSSMIYADDEQESEVISQDADDEKMSEEMAQKIKELEIITIENKGYQKDRKSPAKFEHVKHAREYQISCWECHHEYKDEKLEEKPVETPAEQDEQTVEKEQPKPKYLTEQNIWSPWGKTKKCSECHDPKEKKDDVIMLQAAYHRNCKNCHEDKKIFKDDYMEYRKCASCHTE